MFSDILKKKLESRHQALADLATVTVKVDGVTYNTTDCSAAGMSLGGANGAFHGMKSVHGTIACDGASGPFSGEIVGGAKGRPLDIRFKELPANVLMMLNMLRVA